MQARDADSLNESQELTEKVYWLWIDCMEPDEKELDIIAGLPEGTLKTLQDCIMRVCELDIFSSSVVNRLLYEVGDGNLDVVMGLRTCTDEVEEEEALVNPRDKEVSKEFSAPKREIVTLERIL